MRSLLFVDSVLFLENPRFANARTSYHNRIYTALTSKHLFALSGSYITITNNGDMHAGAVFLTSPISCQSALPVYICARVRPWMVSAAYATIL